MLECSFFLEKKKEPKKNLIAALQAAVIPKFPPGIEIKSLILRNSIE